MLDLLFSFPPFLAIAGETMSVESLNRNCWFDESKTEQIEKKLSPDSRMSMVKWSFAIAHWNCIEIALKFAGAREKCLCICVALFIGIQPYVITCIHIPYIKDAHFRNKFVWTKRKRERDTENREQRTAKMKKERQNVYWILFMHAHHFHPWFTFSMCIRI